jgi:DNA-binding GntR family transcriptional regulator
MTAALASAHPRCHDLARLTLAVAVARGAVARGDRVDLDALEVAVAALRDAVGASLCSTSGDFDRRLVALERALGDLAREFADTFAAPALA